MIGGFGSASSQSPLTLQMMSSPGGISPVEADLHGLATHLEPLKHWRTSPLCGTYLSAVKTSAQQDGHIITRIA
jgi:hypothetical protein